MKTPFEIFFVDKKTDRTLDINYLREKKFAAKPIIDAFKLHDLEYFDEVTGKISYPSYKLYHAEWESEESIITAGSLDELYTQIGMHIFEDIIIEYVGKNMFIWNMESDCYVIFGSKEMINAISDKKYSQEKAKESIKNIKYKKEKEFFINFYNKYNVSFA